MRNRIFNFSPLTRRLPPSQVITRALLVTLSFLLGQALLQPSYAVQETYKNKRHNVRIIDISMPCERGRMHGYQELRFQVDNFSTNKAVKVDIRVPEQTLSYRVHSLRSAKNSIQVDPLSSGILEIYLPPLQLYSMGNEAGVQIDGSEVKAFPLYSELNSFQHAHWSGNFIRVLTSKSISAEELLKGTATLAPKGGGRATHEYSIMREPAPPAEWSRNWLAFSQFDGLVIDATDWSRFVPNTRHAINEYVRLGGHLTLIGKTDLLDPSWVKKKSIGVKMTGYSNGSGEVYLVPAMKGAQLGTLAATKLATVWQKVQKKQVKKDDPTTINNMIDLYNDDDIPVRALFFLMLLFAFIIGPANLYILAKKNRRIWLLWTVPLISAITCLIILLYSLFSEGITAHTSSASFTYLDENTELASSHGWMGVYSPLTPSGGLKFDANTEITPTYTSDQGSGKDVQWNSGQHLSRGWVSARVPAFFSLRKSQQSTLRLKKISQTDDSITLVNGFGHDILSIKLRQGKTLFSSDQRIKSGAQFTLSASSEAPNIGMTRPLHDMQNAFEPIRNMLAAEKASAQLKNPTSSMPTMKPSAKYTEVDMADGTYLIVFDGDPFMESSLPSARNKLTRAKVYGHLKREEAN